MGQLGKWLIGIGVGILTLPVAAFDIGAIIEGQQAKSLLTDPLEKVVTIYPDKEDVYALTRFGHRLYFFSRFTKGQRAWRSTPLTGLNTQCPRIDRIGDNSDAAFGIANDLCPASASSPDTAREWYFDRDGSQLSIAANPASVTPSPVASVGHPNALVKQLQTAGKLANEVTPSPPPTPLGIADFHAVVARVQADPKRGLTPLTSALAQIDWPKQPIPALDLNNAAYLLAQSTDCSVLEDGLALLQHVQMRAPNRAVTYLNLADALYQYRQMQCLQQERRVLHNKTAGLNDRQVTELYRQYCSLTGPTKVPPATAKRVAQRIGSTSLNNTNCHPHYALFRAISHKDLAALAAALSDPLIDIDEFGPEATTALHAAIEANWSEGAQRLISAGARISPAGESNYTDSNLVSAIYKRDFAVIEALLKAGAQVTEWGEQATQPLHTAAKLRSRSADDERHRQQVLQRLLATDPSAIRHLDSSGQTVLQAAAEGYAPPDTLDSLLAAGAYLNQTDKYGRNAAFKIGPFAAEKTAAIATLEWLMAHGINLQQQDVHGNTPLNYLFAYSHSDNETVAALAMRLLQQGADPYLVNQENRPPVFYAAMRPMPAVLAAMLAKPAPVNADLAWVTDLKTRIKGKITEHGNETSSNACQCLKEEQTVAALLDARFPGL